jgi:hypothetical protein
MDTTGRHAYVSYTLPLHAILAAGDVLTGKTLRRPKHRASRRDPLPVTVSTTVRTPAPAPHRFTPDLRTREQKLADQARVNVHGFPRYATRPATA